MHLLGWTCTRRRYPLLSPTPVALARFGISAISRTRRRLSPRLLAASTDVRRARVRIQAFMLRCDFRFEGKPWSHRHRMWLCNRRFAHPAQQIAFQTYLNALEYEERRKGELEAQIKEAIEQSRWAGL